MIEIKHLTKVYKLNKKQMAESKTKNPLKTAVDDLSLKAEEGEIYGLLGPNGAGKTTTLRCIATLIKPTKGEIYVNSHEVQKEPESVRESIGFLHSDIKLDEQFDVDYMFGFFGRLHNIPKDRLEKRKEELFSYFGIQDFAHKKIKELSTGMKQKAAIAVSLVHDPDIVILGGSVALKIDGFVEEIEALVKEKVYGVMKPYIKVRKSTLNEDSGLIGAGYLAFSKQK